MNEQWTTRMQQRMAALYRYTRAMERGDAETISAVLSQAEDDRVLERILLEANEGYQIEDRTVAHADDIEITQHMLRTLMPAPPPLPVPTAQNQPQASLPVSAHPVDTPYPPSIAIQNQQRGGRVFDRIQTLWHQPVRRLTKTRYSWLVAIAAALLILISLPATSVLADQFLALFRVQQFQPVTIDSQESAQTLFTTLQNIGDLQPQRRDAGENQEDLTQAQAEKIIGYHIFLPAHIPAGVSTAQHIRVSGGEQVTYTFHISKARTYLTRHGQGTIAIPAILDGASYTITVAPSVRVNYSSCTRKKDGCPQETMFSLYEVPGPSVQSNGKASITDLRDFLLSLPTLSASAHELLKHLDERTGTIPLPIPPQASAEQVTVHGTSGLLLTSNNMSAVIWEAQGIVYTLALGTGDKTQILDAVDSLH